MLCVSCGGKGYYLLMHGFPDPKNPRAIKGNGEIVSCDCEKGFNYFEDKIEHGKS